jgi:hypothetical protein
MSVQGTTVDGVSTVGTVNVNIDYANMPATYQKVNYIINVPTNWVDTVAPVAALNLNDLTGTTLGITSSLQGVTVTGYYGYTSDNGITASAGGSYEGQYADVYPHLIGLDQYVGSTGTVGFISGNAAAVGVTGPRIQFKFGKVGYQVDWVVA